MPVFAFEFGIDPGVACELQVKARAVIAARTTQVIGELDAVDRDFLVPHELVAHTALEIGLEVATVVQIPLFAHHQAGATGKGVGIVLIHVHAVAGGEVHAFYPVPGKLQLRLDEQAVIKAEHASHFLADASRIAVVGAVDRRAVQHTGLQVLIVPVPAQHGVRVPAFGMLPGGVCRDAVGTVVAGGAMQAVDTLVGPADLATHV